VIRLIAALFVALVMLGTSTGEAHRTGAHNGPPPDGISIPSLTHGQMAVISDNLSAIRALASARIGDDMTTWRLRPRSEPSLGGRPAWARQRDGNQTQSCAW
jgi:hypothetical protein